MLSRILRERQNEDNTRISERQRGVPAAQIRMNSHRTVEILIPTLNRLPSLESNEQLQNEDGTFTFLSGYSAVGGPDL